MTAIPTADVLMITFNSPGYVKLSLPRLLDSLDERSRVWLWHNGTDEETLEVARSYALDARVHKFHHSVANVRLTEPTNWLWSQSDADFVSKVDDDCLLPEDWLGRIRAAHLPNPEFGAIGACRLRPEDMDHEKIAKKRQTFNGVELFRNHWVQGSGYLLKRSWVNKVGLLQDGQAWTEYCLELAKRGAVNGYLFPLLFEDHMDDPRSEHTLLHSDADLEWRMPLSAKRSRVETLDDWQRRLERSAQELQSASIDLRAYSGWRRKARNLQSRLNRIRRA